jgi:predicted permease
VDVNEALKQGVTRTVMAGRTGRMRQALVIGQIALSIVLLTGAGLLIRSFAALNSVDLGFRPKGVLVMETSVPARPDQAARFFRELVAEISTTPGVVAAGATMGIPGHVESAGSYWIDHYPKVATISPFDAVFSVVTPGAFTALQVPINRGRDFNDGDRAGAPLTAIINEALAKKAFRGQDPVGRTIFSGFDSQKPMTIVGVVGNMVQWNVAAPSWPEIFMPYEQHTDGAGTALRVVVRSTALPEPLEDLLRRQVRALSTDVPVRFTTMEKSLYDDVGVPRFRTLLVACFACIALCLAMAGVYGVVAYSAGRRTNEIGLRMALGANTRAILWMIGRQGLALAGVGIALGVAASMATTHLLTSMLFRVNPNDPATWFGVILSLGIITVFACCIPASRAVRVNPLEALRQE